MTTVEFRTVECPELCPGCPVRDNVSGKPALLVEFGSSELPNFSDGHQPWLVETEDEALPDMNRRVSLIAIKGLGKGQKKGYGFEIISSKWHSGDVESAIKDCERPTQSSSESSKHGGALVCTAIELVRFKNERE